MAMQQRKKNVIKEMLIAAYASTGGNISRSCEMARISRTTFLNYTLHDPEFAQRILDCDEAIKDSFEDSLKTQAKKDGNWSQLRYYLETHCKDRGYERDGNTSVSGSITLKIEKSIIPDVA